MLTNPTYMPFGFLHEFSWCRNGVHINIKKQDLWPDVIVHSPYVLWQVARLPVFSLDYIHLLHSKSHAAAAMLRVLPLRGACLERRVTYITQKRHPYYAIVAHLCLFI